MHLGGSAFEAWRLYNKLPRLPSSESGTRASRPAPHLLARQAGSARTTGMSVSPMVHRYDFSSRGAASSRTKTDASDRFTPLGVRARLRQGAAKRAREYSLAC
jgi:hypothetical protein